MILLRMINGRPRNTELVESNWHNGHIGSEGGLSQGHSDASPFWALEAIDSCMQNDLYFQRGSDRFFYVQLSIVQMIILVAIERSRVAMVESRIVKGEPTL